MKKLVRKHLLVHELRLIIDDMTMAMWRANTAYVAKGKNTPGMDAILERFYDWAGRANDEGMG